MGGLHARRWTSHSNGRFIYCPENLLGNDRFVMFAQTELNVPRGAVLDRERAIEAVVEAVANGGSMNDVDRWRELD
jgi:hypothetical protein